MQKHIRLTASAIILCLAGGAPVHAATILDAIFSPRAVPVESLAQLDKHKAFKGINVRASWYGGGERLSRLTSSGEPFRPMARTAAHRSLPFGTLVRVTMPSTGRSTIVRINDRGPAAGTGRSIDLSRGAATDIGLIALGSAPVILEVLH